MTRLLNWKALRLSALAFVLLAIGGLVYAMAPAGPANVTQARLAAARPGDDWITHGGGWQEQRDRWEQLAEGQSPTVMVIACSDSRSEPSQIFDTNPGEIFVVRNVAALVPPYETTPGHHGVSGAIEFAVQMLRVKQIVVMGHGMCGGCKAALTEGFHGSEHGEGKDVTHE